MTIDITKSGQRRPRSWAVGLSLARYAGRVVLIAAVSGVDDLMYPEGVS